MTDRTKALLATVALALFVVAALYFYVSSVIGDAQRNCGDEWVECFWENVPDE